MYALTIHQLSYLDRIVIIFSKVRSTSSFEIDRLSMLAWSSDVSLLEQSSLTKRKGVSVCGEGKDKTELVRVGTGVGSRGNFKWKTRIAHS